MGWGRVELEGRQGEVSIGDRGMSAVACMRAFALDVKPRNAPSRLRCGLL